MRYLTSVKSTFAELAKCHWVYVQVTQYEVEQFQCNSKMLYMIIFGSIVGLGILVGIAASLICHYYRCVCVCVSNNKLPLLT